MLLVAWHLLLLAKDALVLIASCILVAWQCVATRSTCYERSVLAPSSVALVTRNKKALVTTSFLRPSSVPLVTTSKALVS